MSLANLVKIGKLHRHASQRDEIQKLQRGLERSVADTRVVGLSSEGRFVAAYDALLRVLGGLHHEYSFATTLT